MPLLAKAWLELRKLCSPVLFAQVRLGPRGKPFRTVEFCTTTDAEVQGRTCLLVNCGDVGELARVKERLRDGQETLVTWGELPKAG